MGLHPNAIIKLEMTPPEGASENFWHSFAKNEAQNFSLIETHTPLTVPMGENELYLILIKEGDFDQEYKIKGSEGNIVLFKILTFGANDDMSWNELQNLKELLDKKAQSYVQKYNFANTKISISAH